MLIPKAYHFARLAVRFPPNLRQPPLKAHEALKRTKEKYYEQLERRNIEERREGELCCFLRMRSLFLRAPEDMRMPLP
jgi:hypothetical protein